MYIWYNRKRIHSVVCKHIFLCSLIFVTLCPAVAWASVYVFVPCPSYSVFPSTPDIFIHLILFIYFYLGVSFTFQFCSLLALLSLSWIYTVHEVVLGRSFRFSSCIMPKINLRCARPSLEAGLSQRSRGDSLFNNRDRWFVSCTEWSGLYSKKLIL